MSIFGRGMVALARARGLQLRARCADPRKWQEASLRQLLSRAEHTAFGRAYGFARIDGPRAFRTAVPLHRYQDLAPWFERARNGEPDVTWPGVIRYFAMTSGTTAGNKYLPISTDSIRQQQRGGFDPVASYLRWTADHQLFAAKAILLGSTSTLDPNGAGVWVGDNTGIMARHMPRVVRSHYLPSPEVRAIRDWDLRLDALVREAFAQDVRLLAGTPSWFCALFDRLIAEANRRGQRARHVHDIWPHLSLMTGGGVRFEPYRHLIASRLGRHVPYVDVYNATEGGIMGVQDQKDEPGMLLLPDANVYYEFVPLEELGRAQPKRFSLWEVERDVVYALAVTTPSGLFSYLIGDCVRFTQLFPHRFEFEGRTAAFLNVCGEHVSQGELEQAVHAACLDQAVRLREFTVGADIGTGGGHTVRHVFFLEFDGPPGDLELCSEAIDRTLSAHNDDYKTHRTSISGLLPPKVCVLPQGAFERWMRLRGALGGQHKVPRVVLDPAARAQLQALLPPPQFEVPKDLAHHGNGISEPQPRLQ